MPSAAHATASKKLLVVDDDVLPSRRPDYREGHTRKRTPSSRMRLQRRAWSVAGRGGGRVPATRHMKKGLRRWSTAGVDVVVVDTAHGHSVKACIEAVCAGFETSEHRRGSGDRRQHRHQGRCQGIDGALASDAVKVGIGPGSICTTRIVAGVGVPQLSRDANNVSEALRGTEGVPLIADGGIRSFRRPCQGHRHRRLQRDDRQHVCRDHRGSAW